MDSEIAGFHMEACLKFLLKWDAKCNDRVVENFETFNKSPEVNKKLKYVFEFFASNLLIWYSKGDVNCSGLTKFRSEFWFDSGSISVRFGSVSVRFQFGSGSISVWFCFDFGVFLNRFPLGYGRVKSGSGSISIRFWFGNLLFTYFTIQYYTNRTNQRN